LPFTPRTCNVQPDIPNALVHVIQRMQPKTSESPETNLLMRLTLDLIHHEHQNHCFSA
jgi:hypothetical protein